MSEAVRCMDSSGKLDIRGLFKLSVLRFFDPQARHRAAGCPEIVKGNTCKSLASASGVASKIILHRSLTVTIRVTRGFSAPWGNQYA
eukprot:2038531-Amphidinium_carterae.2